MTAPPADWFDRGGFPNDQPYYAYYIEMLAARWNYIADLYLANPDRMILVKYEDFTRAVELMAAGHVITAPLDSRHFAFEQYPGAYRFIDQAGDRSMKVFNDL